MAVALILVWGPVASAQAARGQGVTTDQLPEELRALNVQKQFIRGAGVPVGKVGKIRGHLVVRHGNAPEAYFAAQGDSLYANDELFTLIKSRVRIRFTTADIVNMGADSRIRVDELVDDRKNRVKKTRMSMLRGKAMFYVMRLLKYNSVDTAVKTPTAVCGVRGTKFAVIVRKKTDLFSSMPLYLADVSGTAPNRLLADNGGDDTETVMVMVEGNGYMSAGGTTTNLDGGQTGTAGPTGPPATGDATPGQIQGLNNETNPDAGGGGGDGDDGTGDTGDTGAAGDAGQDATDRTNVVNQQGFVQAAPRPTKRIGYFAALLTRYEHATYSGGTAAPGDVDHAYLSPSAQDHEGPNIVGTSITNGGTDLIKFDGSTTAPPVVTHVDTQPGDTLDTELGPQHQVQYQEVGFNPFLVWGFWNMTTLMEIPGTGTWVIDNAGVYVHGDPTENLNGITGHYVGTAWGTMWNQGGPGIRMDGTMSADVALGSTVLKNLNVSVTDGGSSSVTIWQDPGQQATFDDTANLNYSSGDVNMQINGGAVAYGDVSVGLFGPNGEAMGGAATVYGGGDKAVVGFEGTKQ